MIIIIIIIIIKKTVTLQVKLKKYIFINEIFIFLDIGYTGWVILIYGPEYLSNYGIYKKMV